ncbi:hypothetical protein [uncultured Tyzzerella sp.]|uniref:hypothetical protein n=1 Tax=uncultured Tyzzerella sp. TaxID=2321398 RepID=UPI00294258B3|nr:hypothetical protein [uncultured Tyzzerella sp.]
MNKKALDILAINYIKDKLSLSILNNIYEIGEYFYKDNYDDMSNSIKTIREKLPKHFYNIKNVISQDFDKRKPFIDDIKQDIENIENLSLPFIATLKFADLLVSIISDYYQIKIAKIDNDVKFEQQAVLQEIYKLLDSEEKNNTLQENGGLLLSIVNCSMTKDNYKEYLNRSLNILFEEATERMIDATIETLKFKFAPFVYLQESEDKEILLNIFNKKYDIMEEEELLQTLETLDGIGQKYSSKIGDIGAIYGCFMDILAIYNFAIDTDYLFKDDFILKDMYYYTCEIIENKDFSMYENIENKIESKYEEILQNIDKNEKIIKKQVYKKSYDEYTDAIKVCVSLDDYSGLNFEKNILFKSKCNNTNIATQKFVNEKIEDFTTFISNLNIENTISKKLKQQFFFYIPCPLGINSLKIYFKNALEGLKDETGLLVTYKFLALANPQLFDESVDLQNHHCCDEHCNHNH